MPTADETARRVRAARSYAGMTAPELAEALNVSKETLSRMENGRRAASTDELRIIAARTGVPLVFLTDGFAGVSERRGELEERITLLEQALEDAERHRQEDLAWIGEEIARQVSLGIETGVLPTVGSSAAKGKRAAGA